MRCSKLPLFFKCPSLASAWEHPLESSSDAAELGTVVHAFLAAMVRGQEPELTTIARPSGVDVGEVERLVNYGKKAWKELAPHFPNAEAEIPLSGFGLTGTCDVKSYNGTASCVPLQRAITRDMWLTNLFRCAIQ